MSRLARWRERAFSLLEVVLAVAILGVLAAIVIPRMSRGTAGSSEVALIADLRLLRGAIDHYAIDHGGTFPTNQDIMDQLTQYTDFLGDVQATMDTTHVYGPYLACIPPLPVGARKGNTVIADNAGVAVGWVYNGTTGAIRANCGPAELDETDKPYRTY